MVENSIPASQLLGPEGAWKLAYDTQIPMVMAFMIGRKVGLACCNECMDHDIGRVLMAIANLEGIWDREMRIPEPSRILLVKQEVGKWKLDERGYPIPSKELVQECERLSERESTQRAPKAGDV